MILQVRKRNSLRLHNECSIVGCAVEANRYGKSLVHTFMGQTKFTGIQVSPKMSCGDRFPYNTLVSERTNTHRQVEDGDSRKHRQQYMAALLFASMQELLQELRRRGATCIEGAEITMMVQCGHVGRYLHGYIPQ